MATTRTSQCQIVGEPRVRSWADYRKGCLSTFGGGHNGSEYVAFQHGMETIFNLMEGEFPPAEVCKAGTVLLEACKSANRMLAKLAETGGKWTTEEWCNTQQALANAILLAGAKLPCQDIAKDEAAMQKSTGVVCYAEAGVTCEECKDRHECDKAMERLG